MLILHFKEMFFLCVLFLCLQAASEDVVIASNNSINVIICHVMLCVSCVQRNRNCWFKTYKDVERCFEIDRSFLKQIHCRSSWQIVFLYYDRIYLKPQFLRLRKFIRSECNFNLYNIHFSLRVTSFIQIRSFII